MTTKYCFMCKQQLPIECFHSDSSRVTGLDNKCKPCTIIKQHRWANSNRFQVLISSSRGSAKKRGQEMSIDVDYLKRLWRYQGGLCYWTRVEMALESDVGVRNPAQASIDRLDVSVGYVPGNCVMTTVAANLGRNSVTYVAYYDFMVNQMHMEPLPVDMTYLKFL